MQEKVLEKYEKYMYLKVYVDNDNDMSRDNYEKLLEVYENAIAKHNDKVVTQLEHVDAGFDLYVPSEMDINSKQVKVDFKVICSAQIHTYANRRNTGYYMYARSSLSKSNLRLANCTGIIDSGYRGHIMAIFDVKDNVNKNMIEQHERLVQICAPSLDPILVELVKTKEELGMNTERGNGGFGSTGK